MRSPVFFLFVLICSPAPLQGAQPVASLVLPVGLQRGSNIEVKISGDRLGDAQEIMLYRPGVEVVSMEAVDEKNVKAVLKVAPDCELGIHALRIRTASGISNPRLFTVGDLQEVKEVEPNSDFAAPQPVPLGVTVSGVVQTEDVDHFLVEAKKGDRIVAELEGLRLGYTFFDPYLAILNEQRFELSKSDDSPLLKQDCVCSVIAPEDGKYIIQVRESSYGGDGNCRYRLHIGSFPRPTVIFPAGGKAGEEAEHQVDWRPCWRSLPEKSPSLLKLQMENLLIFLKMSMALPPRPNVLRVSDLDNAMEAEPNNSRNQASLVTIPAALNGVISEPEDIDYFKFDVKKGQRFRVTIRARRPLRSPLDSLINVYDPKGARTGWE